MVAPPSPTLLAATVAAAVLLAGWVTKVAAEPRPPLWPKPQHASFAGTAVPINAASFNFVATGATSETLSAAFKRYGAIVFPAARRDRTSAAVPTGDNASGSLTALTVNVSSASLELGLSTDESYALHVSATAATIVAPTVYGAMHGLETFSQLVDCSGSDCSVAVADVEDAPRFPFRGLMLDPARRFLPLSLIRAVVDAMSYDKMNVLHLHLTDDQSWPLETPGFPNLTATGAFTPARVYSQSAMEALVAYARDRGVRVVPEVDSPGHSLTWVQGAPPGVAINCSAAMPGEASASAVVDPTTDAAISFVKALYQTLARTFTDEAVHIGGDEVVSACWAAVPRVVAWLKAHNMPTDASTLQAYYEQQLTSLVRGAGLNKTLIAWQEVFQNAADPVTTLGPDAVVDVWKGGWEAIMGDVTAAGLRGVLSHPWYLDMVNMDTSWAIEWSDYYSVEPTNFTGATPAKAALVIGGHAALWGEAVDVTNALQRAWPRTSAVAERLWSSQDTTDLDDAVVRLHAQRCRMLSRGITASPVGCLRSPLPKSMAMYKQACWCAADDVFEYTPPGMARDISAVV